MVLIDYSLINSYGKLELCTAIISLVFQFLKNLDESFDLQ